MTTRTKPQNKNLSVRDEFIVRKYKQGFTPTEIREVLMPREGFQKVARSRIYQILEANGIKLRRSDDAKH